MEYRGVEYSVVRSILPGRWRWSVWRDNREKAGMSDTREEAIFRAKKFIDDLTKARVRPTD